MQETQTALRNISLKPSNAERIALFVGELNGNLKLIEKSFSVKIFHKGDEVKITGNEKDIKHASDAILDLYNLTKKNIEISKEAVHLTIQSHLNLSLSKKPEVIDTDIQIRTPKKIVRPRGGNQQSYIKNINKYEINFGIGDAGTGKTYIAVAAAVEALLSDKVQRIVLIRPAVEAGEKLGFLPGDLSQKVDPYLRPLYDGLYEMLGIEKTTKLIEKEVIEVAPLAYLRGRTLNNSFIIMDESQNTTVEQMKMVLTRIGFGSQAVINGDLTQIDLPKHITSGLDHVINVLKETDGIGITRFSSNDVVRHPLVRKIIDAYKKFELNINK
ncbi:MAG: PhoH family protein [Proteobacteria bacterium]|jgi:phosphate starvation-inducible PhoH-like protein|nr:PhoH family protein [Pseudomonadota bacterium]NCV46085.1 PhoH family protein [Pseudomonadota bacterium]NCV99624.1 PhoH family protein [Pseudomonadota bacterium]NCW11311.1 PhoH family protein [Pseudomonadota bacterium]NCW38329.1 PhoH family protein [Pseudomonadota bacterium]|tara:strand:- start:2665 stop:3648 length:984 start_codon:yes stop_codon:yes gene_type:complete